jgi:tubulin epsilon
MFGGCYAGGTIINDSKCMSYTTCFFSCNAEKKPYDKVNNIAANVLLNLTSGMRFEGSLNVDMNDITMNMVPYPQLHFLVPAMSPFTLHNRTTPSSVSQHRAIDRLFQDIMSRDHQLMSCDPRQSMYLACGLLTRGGITAADVSRNVGAMKASIQMPYWNQEVRTLTCAFWLQYAE